MSTFICGDIQSCFDSFMRVLKKANYNMKQDHLILAGDIVNRGPKSLETIDWVYNNREHIEIVLGNHDLHFIGAFYGLRKLREKDTLQVILDSPMAETYVDWLCRQAFIIEKDDFIVCHAGIYPALSYDELLGLSRRAEALLENKKTRRSFLEYIFDKNKLQTNFEECYDEMEKLSFFIASVTRMRCLIRNNNDALDFSFAGELEEIPDELCAWQSKYKGKTLYHGHWAALGFKVWKNNIVSLDSGCVWGNKISLFEHEKNKLFQEPR